MPIFYYSDGCISRASLYYLKTKVSKVESVNLPRLSKSQYCLLCSSETSFISYKHTQHLKRLRRKTFLLVLRPLQLSFCVNGSNQRTKSPFVENCPTKTTFGPDATCKLIFSAVAVAERFIATSIIATLKLSLRSGFTKIYKTDVMDFGNYTIFRN